MDAMLTGFGSALPVSIALLPPSQSINYNNSVFFSFTDRGYIVGGRFPLVMLRARLITEIGESAIYYVHTFLHLSLKQNSSNLTRFYRVVNCNPIRSYNGSGIRYCIKGKIHSISAQKPREWEGTVEAALQTA